MHCIQLTGIIFWASVVTSAFMGIISYYVMVFAERLCMPWQKIAEEKSGGKL
jgi:NitT/TauT family transport system permease protein